MLSVYIQKVGVLGYIQPALRTTRVLCLWPVPEMQAALLKVPCSQPRVAGLAA